MDWPTIAEAGARGLIFAAFVLAFYVVRWAFRKLASIGRRAAALRPNDVARSAGRVAGSVERRAASAADAFRQGRRD